MKDCIFCRIVRKEVPADIVYEDNSVLAFLDAFPAVRGQVLVIPKKHIVPYLFDMNDNEYCSLLIAAKKVAKAIDKALKPIKTGMVVEGLEVEHVHIKLYPLDSEGFKCMHKTIVKPSENEMKQIVGKIKKALN